MRIQKEIDNVERVKNRVATVPLTMEDAVEFHKQVVDRIEKDRKDINKELGIGDVEEDGFTGASKETKKVSTPELKKMKLSESLFKEEVLSEDVDYETYVNNVVKKVSNEDLLNIYVRLSNSSDIFYTETKDYKDFHIAHEVILGRMDGLSDEEIIDKILSFKNESLNEGYYNDDVDEILNDIENILHDNGLDGFYPFVNSPSGDWISIDCGSDSSVRPQIAKVLKAAGYNADYDEYDDYIEIDLTDLCESLNEELEDTDGWGDEIEYILSESFSELENLMYEVRNCRRGSYTSCETAEELADYIHRLAEDLDECSYEIKANKDNINESFTEGGNTFTPVKTIILDKVDEGEDPLTYNEPWDEVQYINRLVSEVEEELDFVVEADTGNIQFTAEGGTGDSVTIDYSDLNEEEYKILAESSSEEEFKNNYRSFLLDLFENPFNESLNEDGLILPPEVQAQREKEEREKEEREREEAQAEKERIQAEKEKARLKDKLWAEKDWVAEREKAEAEGKELDLSKYSKEEQDAINQGFDDFANDETAQAQYKRDKERKEKEEREKAEKEKQEKITKGIEKVGKLPGELINAAKSGLAKSGIHLNF